MKRVTLLLFLLYLLSCRNAPREAPSEAPLDGETLARIHCASCHAFPEPRLLDHATWERHMLPRMGAMLGIYTDSLPRESFLEAGQAGELVAASGKFPETRLLSEAQWERVQAYYLSRAPQALLRPEQDSLRIGLPLFKPRFPNYFFSPPSATMVQFAKGGDGFFVGDANKKLLLRFDQNLQLRYARQTGESPVWMEQSDDRNAVLVMGSFSPTDQPVGTMYRAPDDKSGPAQGPVLQNLQRPVHFFEADLNDDGQDDLVTCEFGKYTGGLAWWQKRPDGTYTRHWLRQEPGATKAYPRDWDQDGRPDVVALFGQGDEGIYVFYNEGDGQFREERLLRFPASYGSSFFDFCDWNRDGHEDIIYTAGDNADYPPILKPYHGIRLFLNDGQNQLEEAFFYPLNGAYQAIPADYDQDGDLDIAAISFFPDFGGRPEDRFGFDADDVDAEQQTPEDDKPIGAFTAVFPLGARFEPGVHPFSPRPAEITIAEEIEGRSLYRAFT